MTKDNSCFQIRLITRLTALACLISVAISYKLWTSDRQFPLSPIFDFVPNLNFPFDYVLLSILICLLLLILLMRNPQKFIIAFLILSLIISIQDMNRWQPWFYQYLSMFFILSFLNYRYTTIKKQNAILTIIKLMIASIYFWSGLQKLNPNFIADTFPWLMKPFHIKEINNFQYIAKSFPIIECLSGLLLLHNKTKKIATIIICLMHLFILYVIGPIGHNYNPVVWFWNIAMVGFCYILFFNKTTFSFNDFRTALKYHFIKIIFILFCLMPQLNFFNFWDSYLSHNLYSGNTSNGIIYLSDKLKSNLPNHIQQYIVGDSGSFSINIKYWCMQETGVPAYPEKRNFDKILNYVSTFSKEKSELYLDYAPKLTIADLTKN